MMKYLTLLLLIGLAWGHDGKHTFLTPYISPGIQIGLNQNKTIFMSCQLTLGSSFKVTNEKHFEDTFPFFLGRTFGLKLNFQREKYLVIHKYYDTQISFFLGGIGTGKLINSMGKSYKKNKFWIGGFGLLSYEKIYLDDKIDRQYSLWGVLPMPIEMIGVTSI